MTIEQLDALFPNRRDECQRIGVDPARHFIPAACLFSMTDAQKDGLFPNRKPAMTSMFQRAVAVVTAKEPAS